MWWIASCANVFGICTASRVGVNSIPELELQLNSNSNSGIGIGIGIEIGGIENGIGIENPGIGIGIGIENRNWIFLQLLPQQLLVNQLFTNFSFNKGGHNLSYDWPLMQQVFLRHCSPVVWSQKTQRRDTLFPLSGQRPEGLKIVTMNNHHDTNITIITVEWMNDFKAWGEIPTFKFQSHFTDWYILIFYDNPLR